MGLNILFSLFLIIAMVLAVRYVLKKYEKSKTRTYIIAAIIILGIIIIRFVSEPGIEAIEEVDPAKTGFLGGLGLTNYFFLDSWSFICWWISFCNRKSCFRFES